MGAEEKGVYGTSRVARGVLFTWGMDDPVAGREYLFSYFVIPTQERIAAKLSYLHRKSCYSHRDASRLQCANISEFSTAVSYGMDPLILITGW